MICQFSEQEIVDHLVCWAELRQDVRAVIWTSSRTSPRASVDQLSDFDIILVVRDIHAYLEDEAWLADFGPILVLYRDPVHMEYGQEWFARITQYENGLKIDFTVWPVEIMPAVLAGSRLPDDLDVGYRVLLDKDGLTTGLKPPTYRAYIPSPPGQAQYTEIIEEFFHEATYAAKYLWRDDLLPAKYTLDFRMKYHLLRRMLEWRMEIDQQWSVRPGAYGRGLKTLSRPDLWAEFEACFAGSRMTDNWAALFRTAALFRKVATEVGEHCGYAYPEGLDRRAVKYLREVRDLGREGST